MHRKIVLFSLLIVMVLIISACGSAQTVEQPTEAQPVNAEPVLTKPATAEPVVAPVEPVVTEPNVLKTAATSNITTWDPIKSFSTEALYMANFYEGLIRINPPSSSERYTPLLAEKWEKSPDGLVWTFTLRKDVKFHDGEPLTADAVVKSIEAAKDHAGASFIWAPLDKVEAVDALTVKFTLKYASQFELIASSTYGAWIVSPKALDATAKDENYFETGIEAGTGPYMLESYTPDKEVLLTRFDGYWGGWMDKKHFDKILVSITPESVQQQQMLESGEVDLAFNIPLENMANFKDKAGFSVIENTSLFNYTCFFNVLRKPLDNKLVRQALSYAIPYDDIIKIGGQGYGTQSRGPVPAGVWPYSEKVPQYKQDLDKARELLKQAGYPDGGFKLNLTYASENQAEERFAPLIKDAFAEVGVDVTIEAIQFTQQWEKAKADPANAQDMFLMLYWPTYSDAGSDNLYSMFRSSDVPFFNLSYWKNEEFDKKIDDAGMLSATDPQKSQQLYEEAMTLLVDEAPGLFLYDTKAVYAIPDYLKGFEYNLNYPFSIIFYPMYTE